MKGLRLSIAETRKESSLPWKTDLIYEGIETELATPTDDFVVETWKTDLIYEGIETWKTGLGDLNTAVTWKTDLIYEGIETEYTVTHIFTQFKLGKLT